ncbi:MULTISPECIES: hypothetical protein [unclassified Microbacterium]|uniref:hypothetical protein n=1 Tax=unclassified Microbacterium TaxID=2609290 RepID=UPI0016054FEC|nr:MULTISPECIES: hypothetical protein [unclassified Microbacterium]QNA91559.1 hypothetical protein G4G29_02265 [Microbacterium sp. Se63.02b]QYM64734.1 hypothetical protein K1X59_02270 [Microbacterium sp. Se5.02b]
MKRAFTLTVAFVLSCGVVVGAAVAYDLLPAPGGDLAPTPEDRTYPVRFVDFVDERTLPLAPTFSEGSELRAAASGTVTSSACVPGHALVSGKAAFAVDGNPVVALSTDVPFYRDLRWGDTGPDVDSLRRALAVLGYSVDASGGFSRDVFEALSAIQDSDGLAFDDGGFHLTDFLWVPAGAAAVAICEAKVGQRYMPESTFATTSSILTALSLVSDEAEQVVPGDRRLQVFGVDAVMPESGVLSDPEALARIAAAPEGKGELRGNGDEEAAPISGTSQLVTPLRVAPVPAASVFDVRGSQGCVASESESYPVTVVGAKLGMSQVTFDGDSPSKILLRPDAETCRAP